MYFLVTYILYPLTEKKKFIEVSEIETKYLIFKETFNIIILLLLLAWYALSQDTKYVLPLNDIIFVLVIMFLISFYKRYRVAKLHNARLSYGNSLKDSELYFKTGEDYNQTVTIHSDKDYTLNSLGKINIYVSIFLLYVALAS